MSINGVFPVSSQNSNVFDNGLYVRAGTVQFPRGSIDLAALASGNPGYGYVSLSGDQSVGGLKTFTTGVSTNVFQLTTNPTVGYILTSDSYGNGYWSVNTSTGNYVDLFNPQTIGGIKSFSQPPVMSGASITANTIPAASTIGVAAVLTPAATGPPGVQTFTKGIVFSIPPVMSGASISTASIPGTALPTIPPAPYANTGSNNTWALPQSFAKPNFSNGWVEVFTRSWTFTTPLLTVDATNSRNFYFDGLITNINITLNITNLTLQAGCIYVFVVEIPCTTAKGYINALQLGGVSTPLIFSGGTSNVLISNVTSAGMITQTFSIYCVTAGTVAYTVSSVMGSY